MRKFVLLCGTGIAAVAINVFEKQPFALFQAVSKLGGLGVSRVAGVYIPVVDFVVNVDVVAPTEGLESGTIFELHPKGRGDPLAVAFLVNHKHKRCRSGTRERPPSE